MTTGRQRAGSGSQQIQVSGDLVLVQGVTEERALEIATDAARDVLAEYSQEAADQASARVDDFNVRLVREMGDQELLDSLADPAMQVLMRRAQLSAASTEREGDYELLARLVAERGKRDSRPLRVAVDRAVQVIDAIDESALQGLTASWGLTSLISNSGDLDENLDSFEAMFEKFPINDLPAGTAWLEDLDLLGLIRLLPPGINTPYKIERMYGDHYRGFTASAVSPETEAEFNERMRGLLGGGLKFVDADFEPGMRRLPFPGWDNMQKVMLDNGVSADAVTQVKAWMDELGIMKTVREESRAEYAIRLRARPSLGRMADWWDARTVGFTRTTAGTAVAYVNAKLHAELSFLPPLDSYLADSQ